MRTPARDRHRAPRRRAADLRRPERRRRARPRRRARRRPRRPGARARPRARGCSGWRRDLGEERAARIRQQERADVAAHLHDSVLQTLALIQKNAANPTQVARLARAQERDLRSVDVRRGRRAAEAAWSRRRCEAAAAEVEDTHGVPVEVVTVGDVPSSARAPYPSCTRPARRSSTRRSTPAPTEGRRLRRGRTAGDAEVFVRDRGRGFDPATSPTDRLGVRNSIVDRMERHGGSAEVRSTPGEGTEVRLRVLADCDRQRPERTRRQDVRTDEDRGDRGRPRDVPRRRARRARRPGRRASPRPRTSTPRSTAVLRAPARGRAARRAPARRRRGRGDAPGRRPRARDRASSPSRSPTRPRTSSARSAAAPAATSPRRSPAPSWSPPSSGWPTGDAVFSPRLAGFVLDAFAGSIEVAQVDEDLDRLTEREREVMRLIARGYAYKEVAVRALHLREDRGDPRLERAAQAPALLAPRADPVGDRPTATLNP